MSYVNTNLTPSEHIIHLGGLHWIIFDKCIGSLFIALTLFFIHSETKNPDLITYGGIFLLLTIGFLILAIIKYATTEIAITNKRIIYKTGLIRRDTIEINNKKTESIKINQSITGRLLGFGSIIISGTGGVETKLHEISKPLEFRRAAFSIIDNI